MQKRFLFIVWAFILAGTCAYCHTAGPCEVSLRRDSRFTGRGNCGEPLLEITFSPSGGNRPLSSPPGNAMMKKNKPLKEAFL